MRYNMSGNGTRNHTITLTGLLDKEYRYFVSCNDSYGVMISTPALIVFQVDTRGNHNLTRPSSWNAIGDYFKIGWNGFLLTRLELQNTTLPDINGTYNVTNVLTSVAGNYQIIYYNPGETAATWTSYAPDRAVFDLTTFNDQTGYRPYFIYGNTTDRLEID